MSGTLPTRQRLNELHPDVYPNKLCPRCSLITEDTKYVFNCYEAREGKTQAIQTINDILQTSINQNPIIDIWQVVELACGITSNIFSIAETDKWTDASITALDLLYNQIWKPRSNSANTAPITGIKWQKKQAQVPKDNTLKRKNKNKNTQNPSPSKKPKNAAINQVQLTNIVSESFLKNNLNYKKCLQDLINSYSLPSSISLSLSR
jgi:hypothetical protein